MTTALSLRQRRILRASIIVGVLTALCVMVPLLVGNEDPPSSASTSRLVDGITDRLARNLPDGHPTTQFVEAATAFGVDLRHGVPPRQSVLPEDMGPGCALEDLDDDGDLDLFFAGFAGPISPGQAASATPPAGGPTHRLFRNDAGHFVDVTQDSGLAVRDFGLGVAVGDIDNDGRLDLYLSNYGKNRLFRNLGGLRFEDITDQAGVGDTGFAGGAVFGDPDRDGDLDLYVCNYLDFRWDGDTSEESAAGGYSLPFTLNPSSYDPQANRYFRNLGDGRFEEVSQALGIDDPQGKSLSATFVDFNEDGWPDLYVLNDVSKNSYFENRGDGSFEDRSLSSLSADYRGAMGNAIGDMDADGDLDLFITHWIAQENGVFANRWRDRDPAEVPTDRGLYFADMAEMVGLGAASLNFVGWGTAYCDFDLNGVLDLVVVNGSTMPSNQDPSQLVAQRPQLFWQKEGWGFYEMGSAAGSCWSQVWNARGLAEGDLDGDGDLDFVVTTNYGPVKILRNEGPTGHWFGLRLRQPEINRFAVGARITLTAGGRRQVAEVGAGTSYLCHRPLTLTFGLGTAMHIEKLEVNWPDGAVTTLTDLDVDQTLTLGPDAGK